MCRACEEEAFYQAYLDHMAKKAADAAATPPDPVVCEDMKERAQAGSIRLAPSSSVPEAGGKQ